jgi:hypothetical protein
MYRKFNNKDELFSNVLLSFILLLLCGFLFYQQSFETEFFDVNGIFYVVLTSLTFIYFSYTVIQFIRNWKLELIDIEIDFDEETIKLRNNRKVYSFNDIQLVGRNNARRETKLYIKRKLFGFRDDALKNKQGDIVPVDLMEKLLEHGIEVKHQHLYNFNFLAMIVLFGSEIMYIFLDTGFTLFGIRITSLIVAGLVLFVFFTIGVFNYTRLEKLSNPEVNDKDAMVDPETE